MVSRLTAFGEAAEVAGHAAFFKTDGLPALRTGLPHKAVLIFLATFILFILEISIFQNTTDGIRYGQDKAVLLKNGILTTDTL